jgi:hypothetical protein
MPGKRRVSVELDLLIGRFVRDAGQIASVLRATSAQMEALGDETDEVARDMDQLAAATMVAKRQVDDLGDEAAGAARDMNPLAASTILAARAVDDLGDEAVISAAQLALLEAQVNDLDASMRGLGTARVASAGGGDGGGAGVALGSAAGSAVGIQLGDGIVKSFGRMSFRSKAIAALVGVAVAASPAIGAIIGGAVVGLTVTGGIAGGIAAASKDPRVKAAAQDFATSISSSFFASGDSFIGPLQRSLRQLEGDFDALDLEGLFTKAAPGLEILSDGVGRFARNLMPGLNDVMDQSVGISQEMADGLAYVGTGLSDMLSEIIASEGTLEGLRTLMFLIGDTARWLGKTINFLGDSFHNIGVAGGKVSGAMEDLMLLAGPAGFVAAKWWAGMNDQMERTTGTGEVLARQIPRYTKAISEAEEPTNLFAKAMGELTHDTQDAETELEKFRSEILLVESVLTDVMDRHFGLEEAQDAVAKSTRELKEQIKEQREEGVKGAGSLTGMTEAAIANREKVRDLSREYAELIFQESVAGRSTKGLQKRFEDTLVAMGFSRTEARKYARELANVKSAMDAIKSKEITLRIRVQSNKSFGAGLLEGFQHGGVVSGPIGVPKLAVVHGGERVLTPQQQAMPHNSPAMFGGNHYAISITVGPIGNPREVGRHVVEAIESYEHANGAGWRR